MGPPHFGTLHARGIIHRGIKPANLSPFSTVAGALASELEDCAARGNLEVAALMEKLAATASELTRQVAGIPLDGLRSTIA